ncbi:MAG: DUF4258 domain-containing protein [Gemmatimonadetes bacterium]|nr:DUF4258 domain-containing protein [Gemmatimonadota bacterium]MYB71694.1 DUF4258 domain-containing protein [Gemmatimonadota bacterium]
MIYTSYTHHLCKRMAARGISETALSAVLKFGRMVYVRGAKIYVIGRKEVRAFLPKGIELADFEGIHVVCNLDGAIMTTYRNRDFRGLRPRGRRHRRRQEVF